jgi:hypothetical protein
MRRERLSRRSAKSPDAVWPGSLRNFREYAFLAKLRNVVNKKSSQKIFTEFPTQRIPWQIGVPSWEGFQQPQLHDRNTAMSEKRISPLRQCLTEDTPAFMLIGANGWLNPLIAWDRQNHNNYSAHYIHQNLHDPVRRRYRHHLDEQPETVSGWQGRDFNHQESVCTMQFKDCRESSSRQSCLCAIFARLNSLKSRMGQNANSPLGNIRAVTLKLYRHPRPR